MTVASTVAVSLAFGPWLAACGSVGAGGSGHSPPVDSGVKGVVVVSPACPLGSTESPCPARRVQAEVEVLELTGPSRSGDVAGGQANTGGGKKVIAVAHTDSSGRFQIRLPHRAYVLQAVPPPGTGYSAKPTPVQVKSHKFTEVTLILDTGIR